MDALLVKSPSTIKPITMENAIRVKILSALNAIIQIPISVHLVNQVLIWYLESVFKNAVLVTAPIAALIITKLVAPASQAFMLTSPPVPAKCVKELLNVFLASLQTPAFASLAKLDFI